jgi:Uma2 family endonuclease
MTSEEYEQIEAYTEPIQLNISHIITEDDEPVDNFPSEKYQRFLIEPLYGSDVLQRPFLAAANVGIFCARHESSIVPAMLLSLGVEVAEGWWAQEHRSYFIWEFGKPPDVVVEVVSNRRGGETGVKLRRYAQLGIASYVIYDPQHLLQEVDLRVYELHVGEYLPRPDSRLPRLGLALTIWHGVYENRLDHWLRWCDEAGNLLLTGSERAAWAEQEI